MLQYLIAIIGFVLLCVFWGMFQLWLVRVDPEEGGERQDRCAGCGGCRDNRTNQETEA